MVFWSKWRLHKDILTEFYIECALNVAFNVEATYISGDFNIIPENLDVYDPKRYENDALFKLEIRKKYRTLINLGFNDVYRHYNKTKQEYTFWDYFAGSWQKITVWE